MAGNLSWSIGHHATLGRSPFGSVEKLKPDGQLGNAYKILTSVMPQLARWQAEGKVDAILNVEGENTKPLSLGGYQISLQKHRESIAPPEPTAPSQTPGQALVDKRPFAIVVNTAPDEFLFIGGNGVPTFSVDSPGGSVKVAVISKDECRYENGRWITGRRLNGDEVGEGLPDGDVGMLKIKLIHFE